MAVHFIDYKVTPLVIERLALARRKDIRKVVHQEFPQGVCPRARRKSNYLAQN